MAAAAQTVSSAELQRHGTSEDCWIIVHKRGYEVTAFLEEPPGGPSIILQYAGTVATAAYDEIHSPGIIEESLPKEAYKGSVSEGDLESLPRADKPTASPDQSPVPEPSPATAPKSYEKPLLESLLNAHDFEAVAEKTFSPKAWGFYSSAATDLHTHLLNSSIFSRIWLRPRVLRNVRDVSTKSSILGLPTSLPIFVSPCALARLAHPDGELALARACKGEDIVQVISTNASFPLAQIVRSSNPPSHPDELPSQTFFLQLYVNVAREQTATLLKHAREIGVRAIWVTVDAPVAGKREADERTAFDTSIKSGISGASNTIVRDAKGGGVARMTGKYIDSGLTWEDIPWIHAASGKLPLVIKGIQTAADAKRAMLYARHGVRGIVLSNHGGRSLDTSQPAVVTLLEMWKVCPEVYTELEVYVDGGVRRGTDVVKALALGARAVGIGRPFLYTLAYGQEGVDWLIKIFRDEVETTLRMLGITDVNELHPGLLNTRDIDHLVPDEDGERHPYAGRVRMREMRARL